MRIVPAEMTAAWKSQAKIGNRRPVVRATIQVANLRRFDYDTAFGTAGYVPDRKRKGVFTSMIFGDPSGLRELRNIETFSWERSLEQDAQTATLTMLNSEMTPIGNAAQGNPTEGSERADQPGYFTFNRGQQSESANRWGFDDETGWQDILVPDRLVKTYEGYGCDTSVSPESDPFLVQSGTWLIDSVTYSADGLITIKMRDLGRLLLQQIVFPPVIPVAEYPLSWSTVHGEQVASRDCTGGDWTGTDLRPIASAQSSNDIYVGKGLTNDPLPAYVNPSGSVEGHADADALLTDGSDNYWLSTGQASKDDKVWWQVTFDDPLASVGQVRLHVKGGPYRVYVSVENGNGWIGRKKVPYDVTTGGVDIEAGVQFVRTAVVDRGETRDIVFKRAYKNVKRIRFTFTKLEDSGIGEYPWRAALRFVRVYYGAATDSLSFGEGSTLQQVGNYRDYTDIVKWICAWGGFFWPPNATGLDFVKVGRQQDPEAGSTKTITYAQADPVLPKGRVWGDLMKSGTAGVYPGGDLTVDLFDKKPLMDVINYIRDTLGFIFFIDETGGVIWRIPNLGYNIDPASRLGNYLSPTKIGVYPGAARTTDIVEIDEEETLLDYSTTLDSDNIRERIFVGNTTGKIGTVVRGFNPHPVGLRRVAGWTDQNFESKQEVRVMADMLNAKTMFEYRRSEVTIPGYPAIQIDDQVRIFERVTNETYYHYVTGISSTLNVKEGTWTYNLQTHWLGEDPTDAWVVDVDQLDGATQTYLNQVGGV